MIIFEAKGAPEGGLTRDTVVIPGLAASTEDIGLTYCTFQNSNLGLLWSRRRMRRCMDLLALLGPLHAGLPLVGGAKNPLSEQGSRSWEKHDQP